jgi:preprotein translocase subunit SecD
MTRTLSLMVVSFLILFGGVLEAQAQFTIRAASDEAIAGWNRMEFNNKTLWVSPTASLTSADITRAEPARGPDGRMAVSVIFNEEGAKKMRALSAAQTNKLIAMVLDGTVIFAPRVRAEISQQAMITSNDPSGLSASVVEKIVASVNRK